MYGAHLDQVSVHLYIVHVHVTLYMYIGDVHRSLHIYPDNNQ